MGKNSKIHNPYTSANFHKYIYNILDILSAVRPSPMRPQSFHALVRFAGTCGRPGPSDWSESKSGECLFSPELNRSIKHGIDVNLLESLESTADSPGGESEKVIGITRQGMKYYDDLSRTPHGWHLWADLRPWIWIFLTFFDFSPSFLDLMSDANLGIHREDSDITATILALGSRYSMYKYWRSSNLFAEQWWRPTAVLDE